MSPTLYFIFPTSTHSIAIVGAGLCSTLNELLFPADSRARLSLSTLHFLPLPTSLLPTGPGRQHRRPPRPPADNCYRTSTHLFTSYRPGSTAPSPTAPSRRQLLSHNSTNFDKLRRRPHPPAVNCYRTTARPLVPGPLLWGPVLCSGARSFALARRPIAPSKPPGPAPEPRDSHTAGRPCCSETSSAPCARSAPGTVRPPPPSS